MIRADDDDRDDVDGPLADELARLLRESPGFAERMRRCRQVHHELEGDVARRPAGCGRLFGDYRLIREIGCGAMGIVYEAWQESLGRRVALKVLAAGLLPNSDALERLRTEARVNAAIEHPGVCTVFDAGEHEGVAYIAMRYVEGETLAGRLHPSEARPIRVSDPHELLADPRPTSTLDSRPPGSRTEIDHWVHLIEKVARVLHVTHESGFVHRDVKPANIMVQPSGEPVLLDFGLARELEASHPGHTQTGDVLGTPVYMSPEQIRGRRGEIDRRTDVWSLGVTLHECLTLTLPFEAATREALFHAILKEEPPDCRRINPLISKDLKTVIDTALDKDPKRRYQTALDFAEDLRRVRARETIRARPASLVLRSRRWAQRNPALVTPVLGLVLLATAAVVFGALCWGPWNRVVPGGGLDRVLVARDGASPETISASAEGWFVGGQPVYLRLSDAERTLLGQVEDGEIRVRWPDLDLGEGTHVAELIVVGPLGREIASPPFMVVVDRTAPQIQSVLLDGKPVSADQPLRVLEGAIPRVRITSDEPLAHGGRTAEASLPGEGTRWDVRLEDAAGNAYTATFQIERVAAPRLQALPEWRRVAEGEWEILTSRSTLLLPFDRPGAIDVLLEFQGSAPQPQALRAADGDEPTYELRLPLDPEDGGEQDLRLVVRSRPDLEEPMDPLEWKLRVRYGRRDLDIQAAFPTDSPGPPSFHGTGEDLLEPEWELELHEVPEGVLSLEVDARGLLTCDGSHSLPSGAYELSIRVRDAYGNESGWTDVDPFKVGIPPPRITTFAVEAGSVGEPSKPIHHPECGCWEDRDLSAPLSLEARWDYRDEDDLEWKLWQGEPDAPGAVLLSGATRKDGVIEVSLADVIYRLPTGSQRLVLALEDSVDSRLNARAALDLRYEREPLRFVIRPDGGLLKRDPEGRSIIRVGATGPEVERIAVNGKVAVGGACDVELMPHGVTPLRVRAELARGEPHETEVACYPEPSEDTEYRFEVSGVEKALPAIAENGVLPLRFHRPRDSWGFWYVEASGLVNLDGAEARLARLREAVRRRWKDQHVRLPYLDEVESLSRGGRLEERRGSRREWLCESEERIAGYDATAATLRERDDPEKEGVDRGEACGLRFILPYEEGRDVLATRDAAGSRPVAKGRR